MSHRRTERLFLENKAYNLRVNSLIMTSMAGSGHPTSCLSAADLVAALFFYRMQYDPRDPNNPQNDRFILSKGHAAPLLYAVWKELGVLSQEELWTYRTFNSVLEGHPTPRFSQAEAATGSLGMGLSIGAGMALAALLDGYSYRTYVLLGDAEVAEGSVWEAAAIAAHYKLNNLVAVLDCNRLGQSTESLHGHHVQRYADKFHAFGWHVLIVDGHDMQEIMHALDKLAEPYEHPTIIIAKTIKGYGVARLANKEGLHGKALKKEELTECIDELAKNFPHASTYHETFEWKPAVPQSSTAKKQRQPLHLDAQRYALGQMMATRESYGHALVALGKQSQDIVSLDGDVKNSTYAELFFQKYPERFFECYVAEQNMVSMAVGLQRRGKIPFVSTFSAFFSRAHDQIRMAAISQASLRLVGSHAGVSIGQDGPSQMGLEDIALMRALPNSIVLYPCDAVSAYALVECMANYTDGISYLRTTRMATPVVYESHETFTIGGCKVLKHSDSDVVCVVAAGVTVLQALEAYQQLQQEGISIAVIDLYSIKPLDYETLERVALKTGSRVIAVEDHYLAGGMGEAVSYALRNKNIHISCLAVSDLPRSGTPQELLAWAGIDAQAIIRAVKQ